MTPMRGRSSRHLGRFIPGEPNIVVQVHAGAAGGLPAANSLYSVSLEGRAHHRSGAAPRAIRGAAREQGIVYDPFKFIWLGSLTSEVSVTMVWVDGAAPHRREDLLTLPLIAGSLGPETDSEIETNAMIRLMGAPIQTHPGLQRNGRDLLALETGETQGLHGMSWSYMKTRRADWLGTARSASCCRPALSPIPTSIAADDLRSREIRRHPAGVGPDPHPEADVAAVCAAAGVPADRVAALRRPSSGW